MCHAQDEYYKNKYGIVLTFQPEYDSVLNTRVEAIMLLLKLT